MTTLRSIFYLVFFSATVVFYAMPIGLLGWVLPYRTIAHAGRQWGVLNLGALKLFCGLGFRIHGRENIPASHCIILSKHQSTWEVIALRALLPPEQTWVLKRELLRIPFFGWALARYQPIAVDRSKPRRSLRKIVEEGRHWLESGRSVVIFPEGTRVAPGKRIRYGQGGAILASKTGYPVVPVAHNAGVFWGRRSINKYPGTVDLVFGKPFDPAGLSSEEINRRVEEWIEAVVAALPQQRW